MVHFCHQSLLPCVQPKHKLRNTPMFLANNSLFTFSGKSCSTKKCLKSTLVPQIQSLLAFNLPKALKKNIIVGIVVLQIKTDINSCVLIITRTRPHCAIVHVATTRKCVN